jgi:hypothetical protein
MEKKYEITEASYVLGCTEGELKNRCMKINSDIQGEFEILERDCKLPASRPTSGNSNDTIVMNIQSRDIFFVKGIYLKEIVPEKMIEVDGKEYSESTLKSALRDYVG